MHELKNTEAFKDNRQSAAPYGGSGIVDILLPRRACEATTELRFALDGGDQLDRAIEVSR